MNAVNPASGGRAYVNYHAGTSRTGVATTDARIVGTNGGLWTLRTKIDGGSLTDALILDQEQRMTLPGRVIYFGDDGTAPIIKRGSATPETTLSAPAGSIFLRTDGSYGSSVYIKENGSGNTGWRPLAGFLSGSATYDAPPIAAAGTTTTTVTVTGAALGDFAECSFGVSLAGLVATAYVSATDTVTVVLFNPTAGAIDLASTTLSARVWDL